MKYLLVRLTAFIVDYLLLACYGGALFGIVIALEMENQIVSPWVGQLVGFFTLTLPVILYFSILESSRMQASIGKRVMRLKVVDATGNRAGFERAGFAKHLIRNFWLFLPWEIAHFGVHWAFYYSRQQLDSPGWVWGPLISSQLMMLIYMISIVRNSKKQGLYEQWSQTRVVQY